MGTTPISRLIDDWLIKQEDTYGGRWSRAEMARQTRIAESTLCRVMNGKQKPGRYVRTRLERTMSLPPGTIEALISEAFNKQEKVEREEKDNG